jgi:hypothetical protein
MPTAPPCVYLQVHRLPVGCRPAFVHRRDGATLLWLHPGALLVEIAFWAQEHLTPEERTVLRLAYGASPDLSEPPPDSMVEGRVSFLTPIPPQLVLPHRRTVGLRRAGLRTA